MKRSFLASLIVLATIFTCHDVHAVPAYPKPVVITQPDGSKLTIRLVGDEFFNYKTTDDGYSIIQGKDGFYYYAELVNGYQHVATDVKAKNPAQRGAADRAVLSKVGRGVPASAFSQRNIMAREAEAQFLESNARNVSGYAADGEETDYLVILVSFQDQAFGRSKNEMNDMMNATGYNMHGATGSVKEYYNQNSQGKFIPNYTVVGPYLMPGTVADYGSNGSSGETVKVREMIAEAATMAYNDGVDFSKFADGTNVRAVCVIFAGVNEAEGGPSNTIWPHRSSISPLNLGGYIVTNYGCTSELSGQRASDMRAAGIGTFTHEFGHIVGWPDFYDTDGTTNGSSITLGSYSLMCNGPYNNEGRTPPALTAQERYMVGWIEPKEITASGEYILKPVSDGDAYIIKTDVNNEYFILENRAPVNIWETTLFSNLQTTASPSLMVYHIDRSYNSIPNSTRKPATLWTTNMVNCFSQHECYKVVRANTSLIEKNWLYPGEKNITSLSSSSHNEYKAWSGNNVAVSLLNISADGNNIKLLVRSENNQDTGLTVSPGYGDALARWYDVDHDGEFRVDLYKGSEIVETLTTREKTAYFTDLGVKMEYTMFVTLIGGDNNDSKSYVFTTLSTTPIYPLMYNIKGEYNAGEEVELRLGGVKAGATDITWTVDGKSVSAPLITLLAGNHTVAASITSAGGTVDKVVKLVTVK